jgi:glycosyltransferase involved in cell wall biosynthesis
MRLGLIIYGGLDTLTGGYLYDRMLVEHLRSLGDEVDIVSIEQSMDGDEAHQVADDILSKGYDLILEDELCHPSLIEINYELRRSGIKLVSIVHHLSCCAVRSDKKRPECLEREYLGTVDGFIFSSRSTRDSVISLLGHDVEGVVAHPGKDHLVVSSDPLSPLPPPPLRMLFVGNVVPHKGLDVLIRAMDGLKDVSLTVIGELGVDPDHVSFLREIISELELDEHVTMLGRTSDCVLREHYLHDHLLVVPSFYEGYGIVYAEAIGHGMPVIAGTEGGAREVVRDGKDGFLVRPGNVAELRRGIKAFRDHPEMWGEMRMNALDRFKELSTWGESMRLARGFLSTL